MSNLQDEHDDPVVFNSADEAVVFNAIAPKAGQIAAQGITEMAGIFGANDALAQIFQDGLLDAGVQQAQFAAGAIVELDCPALGTGCFSL